MHVIRIVLCVAQAGSLINFWLQEKPYNSLYVWPTLIFELSLNPVEDTRTQHSVGHRAQRAIFRAL